MDVLLVDSVTIKENGIAVIKKLSFTIKHGEQWAITGPSGSGKTSLLRAITGRHTYGGSIMVSNGMHAPGTKMLLVEQQHRFRNRSNTNTFYYQQRFNASDAEDAVTVEEDLLHAINGREEKSLLQEAGVSEVLHLLQLHGLLPVKLIQLSNGENKRLQIAKALLQRPDILLMDNPFIGLDAAAREVLMDLLREICGKGIQLILITSAHQVPDFITHVLTLGKEGEFFTETGDAFRQRNAPAVQEGSFQLDAKLLRKLTLSDSHENFEFAVRMKNVKVKYNNRMILENISWEVRNGERWSLTGPNGSGKSTLLSLVNADNPHAYANEIYLFDRRRGTGETIWEIKKRIGFVSPELHLYFDTAISCLEVIGSGFFDTVGLFRPLSDVQSALIVAWMKLLQMEAHRNKLLFQLSNSEQRLVLLARALIKNPPLLILDEPCQGLDDGQVALFKSLDDNICLAGNKTLIYVSHYRRRSRVVLPNFSSWTAAGW